MACCLNYIAVLHDEDDNVLQEVRIARPLPELVLPVYDGDTTGRTLLNGARRSPLRMDTFKRGHSQTRQQGVIETHYYRQPRP